MANRGLLLLLLLLQLSLACNQHHHGYGYGGYRGHRYPSYGHYGYGRYGHGHHHHHHRHHGFGLHFGHHRRIHARVSPHEQAPGDVEQRRHQTFDDEKLPRSPGSSPLDDSKLTTNSRLADEKKTVLDNPVFVDDTEAEHPVPTRFNSPDRTMDPTSNGNHTKGSGNKQKTQEIPDNSPPGLNSSTVQQNSRSDINATSELSAFFNLLKANIGTGMLALPQAFYYAGLWVGFVVTPFIAAIATHCMHLLLQSSKLLCSRTNVASLNYEESMNAAFRTGPEKLRPLATFMTITTRTFICVTQIGFCCVYYEFVCENLYQVLECNEATHMGMSLMVYKLVLFLPFVAICSATELKIIGYMSITSCSFFVVTITIILYYCTRDLTQHPVDQLPAFGGWESIPLYFGTAVFAIEGIGCMLPIENRMADPSNFSGVVGVLNTCMAIVICLYTGIGFFGYVQYSSDIQGAITLNLPSDEVAAQIAKLIVSAAVFLSYPIQLYVVAQLFANLWIRTSDSRMRKLCKNYAVRAACVTLTMVTALALPNVGLFISLVGAISGAMMCLILPPILHLVAVWPEHTPSIFVVAKAIFIVGFGLLGSVVGSITSIGAIIDFFSDYDNSDVLQCSNY
ncbi:Amino acid transporter transmembrane domain [Trinorchestia longiramus]|nr:Amino acid transporter transmembrane domain [Trinorchestia longiramus]